MKNENSLFWRFFMVDICLLGCGGMMPLPDRRLTSMLYRHNGKMILVDCGEGTQIPLKMVGWGFKSIGTLCFTHYHADHVAGLPGFLLTLGNSGREAPLTIFGPPGLFNIVEGLRVIAPLLPYEIKLIELPLDNQIANSIGEIIINSIPVDHTMPCLAYSFEVKRAGKFDVQKAKISNIPMEFWSPLQRGQVIKYQGNIFTPTMVLGKERKGLKVTYCTDTRPTEELVNFINDSDLFICEGMYGENDNLSKAIEKKHMIFSEAATLAKKGNVKELWLTHYSPSLETPEEFIDYAREIFENSHLGNDLMIKSIKFEE
jgi:ribonuclease Z